jgi:hypothetical protein
MEFKFNLVTLHILRVKPKRLNEKIYSKDKGGQLENSHD